MTDRNTNQGVLINVANQQLIETLTKSKNEHNGAVMSGYIKLISPYTISKSQVELVSASISVCSQQNPLQFILIQFSCWSHSGTWKHSIGHLLCSLSDCDLLLSFSIVLDKCYLTNVVLME